MNNRYFSPAKLNLFLRVVRHRCDGYHDISSLFQTIDLGDTITFSLEGKGNSITCSDTEVPVDASNLIAKAAELFRDRTGLTFGMHAHLEKLTPMQAGLGGGSSNAATTLWALNELNGKPATLSELSSWAMDIGSDVAFFLSQGTALCSGRGEVSAVFDVSNNSDVWIVKPHEGLSTSAVYGALDLSSVISQEDFRGLISEGEMSYFNDLERPAFSLMPSLRDLKQRLLDWGFRIVTMSGSGTSFFCIGKNAPPPWVDVRCFKAKFLNRAFDEWYQEA